MTKSSSFAMTFPVLKLEAPRPGKSLSHEKIGWEHPTAVGGGGTVVAGGRS